MFLEKSIKYFLFYCLYLYLYLYFIINMFYWIEGKSSSEISVRLHADTWEDQKTL
jgi:hypothetical protein